MTKDEPKWMQKRRDYQKRYTIKHYTPFTLMTHKEKDKDLIAFLRTKKNKSEYLRELIRRDMNGTADNTS